MFVVKAVYFHYFKVVRRHLVCVYELSR